MNILVIGSGGREHALVWKLVQSKDVQKIYCAQGNGGISQIAECININVEDIKGLLNFAVNNKIDLTVVGPEIPLVLGIVDEFIKHGLKIFGPSKYAAQLEGSKAFSKGIMLKYKVPTANGEIFTDPKKAIEYVNSHGAPIVVKADGLAAGKGVIVAKTVGEALEAIDNIMVKHIFGDSGRQVVVEECLKGEEVSILAFSDGKNVIPLAASQDHKRIYDDDKGPNTGGMGAYSPVPLVTKELSSKIEKEVLQPVVDAMANEGHPYCGILYAGLMMTSNGPKVLEFNVRFGDPETQAILPRMESDLIEPMLASINGTLSKTQIAWKNEACVCVVIASGGYPDKYEKGLVIDGMDKVKDVVVFHAGTKLENDKYLTSGGRVLGVTALGKDIDSAVKNCYKEISKINFKNMHYRKDVGGKALCERRPTR